MTTLQVNEELLEVSASRSCPLRSVVRFGGLVNPNPFELDNPEPAVETFFLHGLDQLPDERSQDSEHRLVARPRYRDAGGRFGWKARPIVHALRPSDLGN